MELTKEKLRKHIREIVKEELQEEKTRNQLVETSFYRKELIDKIRSLELIINLHLMKIILYPDDINNSKWIKDVNIWLFECGRRMLKKNKKLKTEDYYRLFFDEPFTDDDDPFYIELLYTNVIEDYESDDNYDGLTKSVFKDIKQLPSLSIKNKYKSFYKNLSNYFADNKLIKSSHIESLIKKHFT